MSSKNKKSVSKKESPSIKIPSINIDIKTGMIILLVLVVAVLLIPGKTTNNDNNSIVDNTIEDTKIPEVPTAPTTPVIVEKPKEEGSKFDFDGFSWRGTCGMSETKDVSMKYTSNFDGTLNWNGTEYSISKDSTVRPLVSEPIEGKYTYFVTTKEGVKIYESEITFATAEIQVIGNPKLTSPKLYEYPSGLIDYGLDITVNVLNTATMPGCVYVSGTVGSKNIGSKCSYFSTPGNTNAYTCKSELTLDQNNYDYRIYVSGLNGAYVRTGSVSIPV